MIDCLWSVNPLFLLGVHHAVFKHTCILQSFKRPESCQLALALCLSGVGSGVSSGRHDDFLMPLGDVQRSAESNGVPQSE